LIKTRNSSSLNYPKFGSLVKVIIKHIDRCVCWSVIPEVSKGTRSCADRRLTLRPDPGVNCIRIGFE
jgi:hypothetical protein